MPYTPFSQPAVRPGMGSNRASVGYQPPNMVRPNNTPISRFGTDGNIQADPNAILQQYQGLYPDENDMALQAYAKKQAAMLQGFYNEADPMQGQATKNQGGSYGMKPDQGPGPSPYNQGQVMPRGGHKQPAQYMAGHPNPTKSFF